MGMATFRNTKPHAVGLNFTPGGDPRIVLPGETFEAAEKDVPKGMIVSGTVALVKGDEPVAAEPKAKKPAKDEG